MAGLVPAIHVSGLVTPPETWMPATSAGMTRSSPSALAARLGARAIPNVFASTAKLGVETQKARGGACLSSPLARFAKQKKDAERRQTQFLICRAAGHGRASSGMRTSVGIPPRFSPKGLVIPEAQRRAMLRGQ